MSSLWKGREGRIYRGIPVLRGPKVKPGETPRELAERFQLSGFIGQSHFVSSHPLSVSDRALCLGPLEDMRWRGNLSCGTC